MSLPSNPSTGSLKTTVKRMGAALVGSVWVINWSIVTVGDRLMVEYVRLTDSTIGVMKKGGWW